MTVDCGKNPENVRWAHAVNSRDFLLNALTSDDYDFIEADISIGYACDKSSIVCKFYQEKKPIMAHPPALTSDLSFNQWMIYILNSGTPKGLKLDFKDIRTVEPCLNFLNSYGKIKNEVWLNADILAGPDGTRVPVDANRFLHFAQKYDKMTLSVGWTTGTGPTNYSWEHVTEMKDLLRKVPLRIPITFPVRLNKLQFHEMAFLLSMDRNVSLTVWSSVSDSVEFETLSRIRMAFPSKIYYDLPAEQQSEFNGVKKLRRELPPKISVIEADMVIEASVYFCIVEGSGMIEIKLEKEGLLLWSRLDGELSVNGSSNGTTTIVDGSARLKITGTGRSVVYAQLP